MKLKKIASLMLAGIMAVSMLAGCKSGNAQTENPVPETPVTSNVVTYANDVLSGAQKDIFEFKNSADFDTALKAVATDSKEFTSTDITNLNKYTVNYDSDLIKALCDKIDATSSPMTSVTKEGTKKAAWVYGVSGNIEEKAAVQMVVKAFADAAMSNNTYFPMVSNPYALEYAAEISALKVSAPDDADQTIWVVGIVVTQTATENAATKA